MWDFRHRNLYLFLNLNVLYNFHSRNSKQISSNVCYVHIFQKARIFFGWYPSIWNNLLITSMLFKKLACFSSSKLMFGIRFYFAILGVTISNGRLILTSKFCFAKLVNIVFYSSHYPLHLNHDLMKSIRMSQKLLLFQNHSTCGGLRRTTPSTLSKIMFFEKTFKNYWCFLFPRDPS